VSLSQGKGSRLDCKNGMLMTGAMMRRPQNTPTKEGSNYARRGQPLCHHAASIRGVILIMSKPNNVEIWLKRQLGDGKKQVAEDVVIQGMMAGFSEQRTRRAAQALQVTRSYAREKGVLHSAFVERWQIPTRERE
jgi:hypothetical protein